MEIESPIKRTRGRPDTSSMGAKLGGRGLGWSVCESKELVMQRRNKITRMKVFSPLEDKKASFASQELS
jgi:hypothetical protein